MNEMLARVEALLFASAKGLSFKAVAKLLAQPEAEIRSAVAALATARNVPQSGIHVLTNGDTVELVTNPDFSADISALLEVEASTELTRPQLETLTVIAYRGPLTRAEIEQIRGVNCQLILRNLLMRGLVDEEEGELVPHYRVSNEFLKISGLHSVNELPDYEQFRGEENITRLLESLLDDKGEETV